MKKILNRLIQHETLSKKEAKEILINISNGMYNDSQITAFITVYMMRSITIEELEGFRDALLELCVMVDFSAYNNIDLCGTGGDGKDTFNISTLASFVVAGTGIYVTKHGNYGVSSKCGSSNVMEALNITFRNDKDYLERCLDTAGICILHAPLFHPAMKKVKHIRQELSIKTFFNMLGPMVNPAFPKNQIVGVFNLELARAYGYLYQNTDKNFSILHALDGYDEISLTGIAKIISRNNETVISPSDFGIQKHSPEAIAGENSIKNSAELFVNILSGKGTKAQNNVVCANAGIAIAMVENSTLKEGFEKAQNSLLTGKGMERLKMLQKLA